MNRKSLILANHLTLGFAVIGMFISVASLRAADSPEYIKVEKPLVSKLRDSAAPTDAIGYSAKSWIEEQSFLTRLPSQVLPRLWDQYIPVSGSAFFDDINFSVSPRFYYFRRDTENVGIAESAALGGALAMESGWWRDFLRLNLTGYTSQKMYGPSDRDGTTSLREGQESYTVLGEAFAELKMGVIKARAGRTRIDLPYINAYDIRMTPNTFEGVGFSLHSLRDFQLGAGHLNKIKLRNRSSFESMSQRAGVEGQDRGVSFVGARYNFSKDSHIGAVNQYGWDMFNTFYAEASRFYDLGDDFSIRLGTQFTDQRSAGDELLGEFSTQAGGVRAAIGLRELVASAAFVATSRGGDVRTPWGGSPTFRSSLISDQDRAGERAVRLGVTYGLDHWGAKGLTADLGYLNATTPDTGSIASPSEQEYSATLDYRPPVKLLDDFWLRIRYAVNNQDSARGGNDREDFRIILNYSYAF